MYESSWHANNFVPSMLCNAVYNINVSNISEDPSLSIPDISPAFNTEYNNYMLITLVEKKYYVDKD